LGKRLGALALLVTLLALGAFLGSSLSQWGEGEPPPATTTSIPTIDGRIRVEVLNGGGRSGVAREATVALRELGFDVVYYGNAETFSDDPSVVLDRGDHLQAARWAGDALAIRNVQTEPDTTRYVDVTVRLGPEWSLPESEVLKKEAPAPWWDVRRWFRNKRSGDVTTSTRP